MIDALMTGEMERYATTDLNRPLLESEIQTIEKVISFVASYWPNLRHLIDLVPCLFLG